MAKQARDDFSQLEKQISSAGRIIAAPFYELAYGVKSRTIPMHVCFASGIVLQIAISFRFDREIFQLLNADFIYPSYRAAFLFYYIVLVFSPFAIWAVYRAVLKQHFLNRLTVAFQQIGLRNGLGKVPNFIFDKPLDSQTRKLRISRVGISPSEFEKRKDDLAGALHIFVDEVRENRAQGSVDFIYGREPMPREFVPENYTSVGANKFLVGITRSKRYLADLRDTPHLLIAGQTGGGKSTFLRQFITSLYLNNSNYEFFLIDLKGGLEFQLFERLARVTVIGDVPRSAYMLGGMAKELQTRMALLKEMQCKDIVQFHNKMKERGTSPRLRRKIIVVDEAAELFLAGSNASSADVQNARRILSQIARQGRSLGIHLVIATQRPDSKALDPQIKANLPGVLCFQMVNDVSSISVLGNGRATDLPPTPGRALWKNSLDLVEVQTPYMTLPQAESLLNPHLLPEDGKKADSVTNDVPCVSNSKSIGQRPLGKEKSL